MVDSTGKCADGWDPSELLAYLEGDLPPVRHKELDQHLAHCKACSSQMESLREMDGILRACPQCFHPDEEDLFRFVSRAEDPGGRVSAHLETCEECQEAVAVFREMLAVGSQIRTPQPLPGALLKALEKRHPSDQATPQPSRPFSWLLEWFRRPFRVPLLAAGTVVAALLVAVLLIPSWTGRYVPKPEPLPALEEAQAPVPPVEKRKGTLRRQTPVSDYRAKNAGLHGMMKSALPESKPALVPGPTTPPLGKAEPLKAREGLGAGLVTPKPSAPAGSEITAPGRSSPEVRKRRGDFRTPGVPLSKNVPVQPTRPLRVAEDAHAKPKVLVRIVLPEGQEFDGLGFVPSMEMRGKYSFAEQKTDKEEESAKSKARRPLEAKPLTDEGASYVVTVRVSRKGAMYGLEGSLSKPGATTASKTLSKDNIPRKNLQLEISGMVAALLAAH